MGDPCVSVLFRRSSSGFDIFFQGKSDFLGMPQFFRSFFTHEGLQETKEIKHHTKRKLWYSHGNTFSFIWKQKDPPSESFCTLFFLSLDIMWLVIWAGCFLLQEILLIFLLLSTAKCNNRLVCSAGLVHSSQYNDQKVRHVVYSAHYVILKRKQVKL